MKRWIEKLVSQFNFESADEPSSRESSPAISDERATLLFMIDQINKHLIEFDAHPVRKTRDTLDEYARELILPNRPNIEKLLFRFRLFFGAYRLDEYTYIQKTFDEFRGIIWDFVDQLSEDLSQESTTDREIQTSLSELREAVESNSIDVLKTQSRKFIDSYVEHQTRKDKRRTDRIVSIKKNLDSVRRQLLDANQSMRVDHLTSAYNRKSFDEQVAQHLKMQKISPQPLTLIMLDIDHFKKINDTFGHPVGDFVLKECVNSLREVFSRREDFLARIGGEEFAVLLPGYGLDRAVAKAEEVLARIRKDVFVNGEHEIRFTISMGLAVLQSNETSSEWLKRADEALYSSKNNGRNRYTVAVSHNGIKSVA